MSLTHSISFRDALNLNFWFSSPQRKNKNDFSSWAQKTRITMLYTIEKTANNKSGMENYFNPKDCASFFSSIGLKYLATAGTCTSTGLVIPV